MTFTFLEDSTLIAECEISVERLARHDEDDGYLYDVKYEGERCGEVNIRVVYKKPSQMGMMGMPGMPGMSSMPPGSSMTSSSTTTTTSSTSSTMMPGMM